MAISKRLRQEVFRRDNHTCHYCGHAAPEVKITIDHVVPETLGGSNDPSNLVTACADCNAGKSSMPADAPLIANVAADAERWSFAMQRAAELRSNQAAQQEELLDHFEGIWSAYWIKVESENDTSSPYRSPGRWYAPRPRDWQRSVLQFVAAGLDEDFFARTVRRALYDATHVGWEQSWRYFCGICWRELDDRREIALALLESEDSE